MINYIGTHIIISIIIAIITVTVIQLTADLAGKKARIFTESLLLFITVPAGILIMSAICTIEHPAMPIGFKIILSEIAGTGLGLFIYGTGEFIIFGLRMLLPEKTKQLPIKKQ